VPTAGGGEHLVRHVPPPASRSSARDPSHGALPVPKRPKNGSARGRAWMKAENGGELDLCVCTAHQQKNTKKQEQTSVRPSRSAQALCRAARTAGAAADRAGHAAQRCFKTKDRRSPGSHGGGRNHPSGRRKETEVRPQTGRFGTARRGARRWRSRWGRAPHFDKQGLLTSAQNIIRVTPIRLVMGIEY
jgi:hypothetical protein